MTGFQAAGSAPIYFDKIIENPETVATAIRIGNPASWAQAKAAIRDSKGSIDIVTDQEILDAQAWLAANEGIFIEPGSAASVAGLLKCLDCNREPCATCPVRGIPEGSTLVLTVTGHGLKDIDAPLKHRAFAPLQAANSMESVLHTLGY
jgi:threonine synthase